LLYLALTNYPSLRPETNYEILQQAKCHQCREGLFAVAEKPTPSKNIKLR